MQRSQSLQLQLTTETEQKQNFLKDLRLQTKKAEESLSSMDDNTVAQKELLSTLAMSIRNLYAQLQSGTAILQKEKKDKGASAGLWGSGGTQNAGGTAAPTALSTGLGRDTAALPAGLLSANSAQNKRSDASLALYSIPLEELLKRIKEKMEDLQCVSFLVYSCICDVLLICSYFSSFALLFIRSCSLGFSFSCAVIIDNKDKHPADLRRQTQHTSAPSQTKSSSRSRG